MKIMHLNANDKFDKCFPHSCFKLRVKNRYSFEA